MELLIDKVLIYIRNRIDIVWEVIDYSVFRTEEAHMEKKEIEVAFYY